MCFFKFSPCVSLRPLKWLNWIGVKVLCTFPSLCPGLCVQVCHAQTCIRRHWQRSWFTCVHHSCKTVKLNVNIQKDKKIVQFKLHCNDEEKKWTNVNLNLLNLNFFWNNDLVMRIFLLDASVRWPQVVEQTVCHSPQWWSAGGSPGPGRSLGTPSL